jgi:hypothetical protein
VWPARETRSERGAGSSTVSVISGAPTEAGLPASRPVRDNPGAVEIGDFRIAVMRK